MVVLRRTIGDVLRDERRGQQRTLREVSSTARVSLGYLSEVERGQKEASSELLASICTALDVPLSEVLGEVTRRIADEEGVGTRRRYAAEGIVPAPAPRPAAPEVVDPADAVAEMPEDLPSDLPEDLDTDLDAIVEQAVDSVVDHAIGSALGEVPSREFSVELEGLPAELELIVRRRLIPAA